MRVRVFVVVVVVVVGVVVVGGGGVHWCLLRCRCVFGGSFGSRLPWVVGDAWLARTVSNVIAEGLAA